MINCKVLDGAISGNSSYVGGLVGYHLYGTVSNCSSIVNISGKERIGGLIGYNTGIVSTCYSKGCVTGDDAVGGLIGQCWHHEFPEVSNCYSHANVSGTDYVGGLVGVNGSTWEEPTEHPIIANCYSAGCVEGDVLVGGFVGVNSAVVSASFWDSDINPDMNGIGNTDDPNVIGKTTAEMQMKSTFTDAGWDFIGEIINGPNDIWDICDGTNYPKLTWQQPVIGDFVCPDGVDFIDYSVIGSAWLSSEGQSGWNEICDISDPNDNTIDWKDLKVLSENWLAGLGGSQF